MTLFNLAYPFIEDRPHGGSFLDADKQSSLMLGAQSVFLGSC